MRGRNETSLSGTSATTILQAPNTIPFGGTLPRCAHDVYHPFDLDAPNPGCSVCVQPSTNANGHKKFVIPTGMLNERDKLRAGVHDPHFCPRCGCGIHAEDEQGWTCAECSTTYPAPKHYHE